MIVSFIIIFGTLPFPIVTKLDERFIAESASDFLIGKCLAKLQARAWLSHALHFAHLTNTLQKDVTAAYVFTHNAPKCRILIETFPDMLRYSEFPRCEGALIPHSNPSLTTPRIF